MSWFFTSDEHYGHTNIIKYVNRPFKDVIEMDHVLIENHNKVVKKNDYVIHLGDFCMSNIDYAKNIISKLNGSHSFIRGSHDRWLFKYNQNANDISEMKIYNQIIVLCHYPMRIWPRSHYGSWQLFGHIHSKDISNDGHIGKQLDVGVDGHNFYPYSFDEIFDIMKTRPNNVNLIKDNRR